MLLSNVRVTALLHFCLHLDVCLGNAFGDSKGDWNVTFALTNVHTSSLCRRTHVVPNLDVYMAIVNLNIYPANLLAFEDVFVLLQDGSEVCAIKVSLECETGHHPNSKCICVKKAPSAYLLTIKDKFRANQSSHEHYTHNNEIGIWLEARSTSSLLPTVRKFLPFANVTLAPDPSVHLKLDGVRTDLDGCSGTFPMESQHSILFCVKGLRRATMVMRYHSETHEHVGTECFYMEILIPEGHSLLVLSYHDDCGRSGSIQCKIRGTTQPQNVTRLLHLLQQIKDPEDEDKSPVQMFEANKTLILSAVGIVVILASAACFTAYIAYVEHENRKKRSEPLDEDKASITFSKFCELSPIVGIDELWVRLSLRPRVKEYFTLIRSSADANIVHCKFHVLEDRCKVIENYLDYRCECNTVYSFDMFFVTHVLLDEMTKPLDDKTLTLVNLEIIINESISPKEFKTFSEIVGPTETNVKIQPPDIIYLEVDNVKADLLDCSKKYAVGSFHTFTFCTKNLIEPKIDLELNGRNVTTRGPCAKISETIAEGEWVLRIHYTDSRCSQKSNKFVCQIYGIVLPTNQENSIISNITDLNKKSGYTDPNMKNLFSRKEFYIAGGSLLGIGVLSVIGYLVYSSYFSGDSKSSFSLSTPSSIATPVV